MRVVRPVGHNTLPNLVGPSLPRNDDQERRPFYCASVLMLLKPWRDIRRLKEQEQIWENALESFLAGATPDIH